VLTPRLDCVSGSAGRRAPSAAPTSVTSAGGLQTAPHAGQIAMAAVHQRRNSGGAGSDRALSPAATLGHVRLDADGLTRVVTVLAENEAGGAVASHAIGLRVLDRVEDPQDLLPPATLGGGAGVDQAHQAVELQQLAQPCRPRRPAELLPQPSDERRRLPHVGDRALGGQGLQHFAGQRPHGSAALRRISTEGLLCIQDELSGFFGRMDAYSGGAKAAAKDRSFWLRAFDGGPYSFNRINRGSGLLENVSISLLGGIQPEAIRKVAADSVDDGLLQRLFPIVLAPASVGKDVPSRPVVEEYGRLVEQLCKLRPPSNRDRGAVPLQFDDGAQAIRADLEEKHWALTKVETINKKLAAHIGKLDGLFARLCVIWHCVEHAEAAELPVLVTEETARRVASFLHRYLLRHAFAFYGRVLGLSDDHDQLTAVAGYILARRLETVTTRDVTRGKRSMRNIQRRDAQRAHSGPIRSLIPI
jgi:hypothetical protein